jgi:hypothetical protein
MSILSETEGPDKTVDPFYIAPCYVDLVVALFIFPRFHLCGCTSIMLC